MELDTNIKELNRVGGTVSGRLSKLGLLNAKDLLFYFPFRYDDYSQVKKIDDLKEGEKVNIVGQIELIQNKRAFRKKMYITEALVSDDSESIKIVWFNQPFIAKNLKVGDRVSLAGKVEDDHGIMTMRSPIYEKVGTTGQIHTTGLVPIYHLTENISQKQLRFLIKQVIKLTKTIPDPLPDDIKKKIGLLSLGDAIFKIHFPKDMKEASRAKKKLAFDELFLMQLKSQIVKLEREKQRAEIIEFKEKETKEFVDSLPFKLTDDQKKTSWQILKDMENKQPMSRLLDGDVGSGKTVVATIAMLNVALNNKQSIIMVPTEILARQHFYSISKALEKLNIIKVALLTNSQRKISTDVDKKLSRKEILDIIKKGEVDIVVGTHALVQDDVKFADLALSIVDEQHRFGVKQRKALTEKSGNKEIIPHLLSMTATPIPRSLALALFGDLDISLIKEKPKMRKEIVTKIILENKRLEVYEFIKEQIKEDRQVFVVCPLIEESDLLGVKSVKEEFAKLDKKIFPHISTAMLHGKMKPKEKEKIMQDFLDKKYKILVSTSVVEVGVDIPNATIMMIEGAHRFGLAQLHQFRGRVGRGEHQSYCFLFTESLEPHTLKRLNTLVACSDGFDLAKMDLELRGAGEIYGTTQKGFLGFKIATLFDYELINIAKKEAEELIKKDPDLKESRSLSKEIVDFIANLHLE